MEGKQDTTGKDKRRTRSDMALQAINLQLEHVVEALGLDVMVLADDLGFPVAKAGDGELAEVLAESAMWTDRHGPEVDPLVMERLQDMAPHVMEHDVVSCVLDLPGMTSWCRLITVGPSKARVAGLMHAAVGLRRISTTAAWVI